MAHFSIGFGVKTRVGCGGKNLGFAPGTTFTGTDNADWATDAVSGYVIPAGATYMAAKTYLKSAGQTYNLTASTGDTVDILMVAARADMTVRSTDTGSTASGAVGNQLKTVLELAQGTSGALVLGDTVMVRDETLWSFDNISAQFNLPTQGYGGAGTITQGGAGYTTGTFFATGGSGSNAQLYVVTSGGTVIRVAVIDPGTGYQAGDVLTVPGGTGFQYTVIDLAGRITIRSETPDLGLGEDGVNARRGGGATFVGVTVNANTTTPYVPIDWKYLDFEVTTTPRSLSKFIGYRDLDGYGMGSAYCHFAVPDSITITGDSLRIIAFENRLGTIDRFYAYRCRRVSSRADGIGSYNATTNNIPVTDTTVLRSVVSNGVARFLNGDGVSHGGTKNDVYGNFFRGFVKFGSAHQDPIQHTGFGTLGVTLNDVLRVWNNVIVQDDGLWAPQGIFASDTDPPTQQTGIEYRENLTIVDTQNTAVIPAAIGPQILRLTGLSPALVYNTLGSLVASSSNARLYLKQGTGGYVDRSVFNSYQVSEALKEQVGVEITANNDFIADKATYAAYFVNPILGPFTTAAAAMAAWAPIEGGALRNADGTYNGAVFPNGSWNNGTVYLSTPPSTITSSASSASVVANQTVTITFQLNAAANQAVTITPALAGVSGSFSAATVVIGVGESSGTVNFTPTTAGSASITCTNNRSLANPSALVITVTSAAAPPTAYTQAADRTATVLDGSILVTYTLNQPAVTSVTITPAVSGLAGAFSSPTVVITNGQTQGSVTFFPGAVGSGSLTASDGSGLTDPAGISITVAVANKAQLMVLGLA